MTDKSTGMPMRVSKDGRTGPYLIVRFEQVPEVKRILDSERIHYWVDETAVSVSDGPYLTVINFARATEPDTIQKVLDRAG